MSGFWNPQSPPRGVVPLPLPPGESLRERRVIAIDLGKRADYTAFAFLEEQRQRARAILLDWTSTPKEERPDFPAIPKGDVHVRYLERVPKMTPYPEVRDRLKWLTRGFGWENEPLVVDQTGVGEAVVDELRRDHLDPIGIVITGGQVETRDASGTLRVPKVQLASVMAVLVENRRLKTLPGDEMSDLLAREMRSFTVKVNPLGHETLESWREADHDDLVLAVALGGWWLEKSGWAHDPAYEEAILALYGNR